MREDVDKNMGGKILSKGIGEKDGEKCGKM
jgi:hypothetical protein